MGMDSDYSSSEPDEKETDLQTTESATDLKGSGSMEKVANIAGAAFRFLRRRTSSLKSATHISETILPKLNIKRGSQENDLPNRIPEGRERQGSDSPSDFGDDSSNES